MKYLIYISTASIYFKPESLQEMLIEFRKHNATKQITGLMLFGQGQFLQLIEGRNKSIDFLYKHIEADRRHHSLIILASGTNAKRFFPDWSMGFKTLSTDLLNEIKGFINPLKADFLQQLRSDQTNPVIDTILSFAANLKN